MEKIHIVYLETQKVSYFPNNITICDTGLKANY